MYLFYNINIILCQIGVGGIAFPTSASGLSRLVELDIVSAARGENRYPLSCGTNGCSALDTTTQQPKMSPSKHHLLHTLLLPKANPEGQGVLIVVLSLFVDIGATFLPFLKVTI